MPLIRYKDARSLLARAEAFLTAQEAPNNLMLGILAQLGAHLRGELPYLAAYASEADVEGVAIRTPPQSLLISTGASEPALRAFADDLRTSVPDLPGVLAESKVALAFARIWRERTGVEHERTMAERVYELTAVARVPTVPGRMRRAGEADRPLLEEWISAFQKDAGAASPDPQRTLASRFGVDPAEGGMHLWEAADGAPASLAGYAGRTPTGIRVGPVYTPPPLRGRGYATALVASLSARLLADGRARVFLYTDLANGTANDIYQRIGYRPVCDADQYRFLLKAKSGPPA